MHNDAAILRLFCEQSILLHMLYLFVSFNILHSIPDDIKKEVLKYVVLTNVEPNVHLGGDDDLPTRLKADEESYPLEKAVFLPHKLLGKYGCGQLYIRHPYDHEHDQAHEQCADQCDNVYGQQNVSTMQTHAHTRMHTHILCAIHTALYS